MHACLLESKQLWAGQASTASLLLECTMECMVCLPAWQVSDGVAVEWLSLLSRSAES